MTESKWHPVIKFVSGTLLLADEVLNIWYYNTHEDSLRLMKIRTAFAAAIAVVPICYFVIAAYFLYPEYQENLNTNYQPLDLFLKKGISRPAGKLKNCLKSVRAKFTIIIAVLLGILVGFGFLMWSFGVVIVGIVVVSPSLLGLVSDVLIWFGSSCYLALFMFVKFFNCTSYHTISECMGSDSRQQLNHRDKILMFVMILNAIQLKLQSFPCLVMKIVNEVLNNPVQKIFGTGIIISIINIVAQIVAFYVMRKEVLHIRRLNESETAQAQGMIIDVAV